MQRPRRALTLVELLVVLLIIAIASAVVVPNFGGRLRNARLREAALTFAEHLHFAQLMAMEKERPVRATLDRQANAYRLELASNLEGLEFGPMPELGASGRVLLPEGIVWGQADAGLVAADQTEAMLFEPAGIWSSGDVTLTNGQASWVVRMCRARRQVEAFEYKQEAVEEARSATLVGSTGR